MSSRLDDWLDMLLNLFLSLVQDELAAFLLSFSTLAKPDNPSLLCLSATKEIHLSRAKILNNELFNTLTCV